MRFLNRVFAVGLVMALFCATPAFADPPGLLETVTATGDTKEGTEEDESSGADESESSSEEETTAAEDSTANMTAVELGRLVDDKCDNINCRDDVERQIIGESVSATISGLRTDGYTNEAIAGVLANMQYECCFDPFLWEGKSSQRFELYKAYLNGERTWSNYGTTIPSGGHGGCGLIQWTYGRHKELSDHCKDTDPDSVVINSPWETSEGVRCDDPTYLGTTGTQVAYILKEQHQGNRYYASANANTVGGADYRTSDKFKTITDSYLAARLWCACVEICDGWSGSEGEKRAANAENLLEVVVQYQGGALSSKEAEKTASQMISAGYWSEAELSEFAKLEELNVQSILDSARLDKLEGEDLEGLSWWKRNVLEDKATNGAIAVIRKVVQLVGILFIIWVIFIYLSYWFDRINNFFYIDLLGVLTLGFLHMSDTEESCTFKLRDLGKGDRRTVNHIAILEICGLGIFFGVFIITGAYYRVIAWIIRFVTGLFAKWL